jgi:phenylalanyl-tRNA synthetase beta chain
MSLSDKLPRIDTFTFEVDNKTITHRPDLTGHFGLACELNAIYRMHSPEELTFENTSTLLERVTLTPLVQMLESSPKSSKKLHITSDLVHSYMYIQIPDIVVHRSSLYTRSALLELGSTPRNNWVDFSNMFMYVTGQPIHCFDADKIHGDIFVKQLEKTEEFIDLMGQKHQLEK